MECLDIRVADPSNVNPKLLAHVSELVTQEIPKDEFEKADCEGYLFAEVIARTQVRLAVAFALLKAAKEVGTGHTLCVVRIKTVEHNPTLVLDVTVGVDPIKLVGISTAQICQEAEELMAYAKKEQA